MHVRSGLSGDPERLLTLRAVPTGSLPFKQSPQVPYAASGPPRAAEAVSCPSKCPGWWEGGQAPKQAPVPLNQESPVATIRLTEEFYCRPDDIFDCFVDTARLQAVTQGPAEVVPRPTSIAGHMCMTQL